MKLNHLFLTFLFLIFALASYAQVPNQDIEFKEDFKTKYNSEKYNYEGKKVIGNTKTGEGNIEDYKSGKPVIEEEKETSNNNFSINLGPFAWLFYLFLIAGVVFIAYILLNDGASGLFSTRKHTKIKDFDAITAENIEHADIKTLITNAENNKDYRLATRYYYLLVLKSLSLKNFIRFEDDKTNADYSNELIEKPFSKKFNYISYLYNYIWYGEFPLKTTQYNKTKSQFVALLNQIK